MTPLKQFLRRTLPSLLTALLLLSGNLSCAKLLAPAPDQFNVRKAQKLASGEVAPKGFIPTRDRKGQKVFISKMPAMVFREEGITVVSIVEDFYPPENFTYNVLIQLESSLAEKFEGVTKSLINGWLALCRGQKVIIVARVYAEIKGGRFFLGTNGSMEDAEALAKLLGFKPTVIRYSPQSVASLRQLHQERERRFMDARQASINESPLWTVIRETALRAEPNERGASLRIIRPPWMYPQSMRESTEKREMRFLHLPGWIALDTGSHQGWVRRGDVVPDIVASSNVTLQRNLLGHLIGERCPEEEELTPKEQRIYALYRMSIEREFRRRLKSEEAYTSWYQDNVQSVIEGRSCQQLVGINLFPAKP